MENPSCRGCYALEKTTTFAPRHPKAGYNGWVRTCVLMREEGSCPLMVLQEMQKTQLEIVQTQLEIERLRAGVSSWEQVEG